MTNLPPTKLIIEVNIGTTGSLGTLAAAEQLRAIADGLDPRTGSEKVAPAADESVPLVVVATPPPEPSAPAAPSPAREASALEHERYTCAKCGAADVGLYGHVNGCPPGDLRAAALRAECNRLSMIIAERNNQLGDLTESLQSEKAIGRQVLKELDHLKKMYADLLAVTASSLGMLLSGRISEATAELRKVGVKIAEARRG